MKKPSVPCWRGVRAGTASPVRSPPVQAGHPVSPDCAGRAPRSPAGATGKPRSGWRSPRPEPNRWHRRAARPDAPARLPHPGLRTAWRSARPDRCASGAAGHPGCGARCRCRCRARRPARDRSSQRGAWPTCRQPPADAARHCAPLPGAVGGPRRRAGTPRRRRRRCGRGSPSSSRARASCRRRRRNSPAPASPARRRPRCTTSWLPSSWISTRPSWKAGAGGDLLARGDAQAPGRERRRLRLDILGRPAPPAPARAWPSAGSRADRAAPGRSSRRARPRASAPNRACSSGSSQSGTSSRTASRHVRDGRACGPRVRAARAPRAAPARPAHSGRRRTPAQTPRRPALEQQDGARSAGAAWARLGRAPATIPAGASARSTRPDRVGDLAPVAAADIAALAEEIVGYGVGRACAARPRSGERSMAAARRAAGVMRVPEEKARALPWTRSRPSLE